MKRKKLYRNQAGVENVDNPFPAPLFNPLIKLEKQWHRHCISMPEGKGMGRLIFQITCALLALPVSGFAGGTFVSGGGGSADSETQIILEAFLENNRLIHGEERTYYSKSSNGKLPNLGPGMIDYLMTLQRQIPDLGLEMSQVLNEKPWFLIDFNAETLKKFNQENQEKLRRSGFLRNAELKAFQVSNAVFIDKKYHDEQLRLIQRGTPAQQKAAWNNLTSLYLKELVRAKEIASRAPEGQSPEAAIGRGGPHRYGMLPMTEDGVWRVTLRLKEMVKFYYETGIDLYGPNSEAEPDNSANEIHAALEQSRYGYYLTGSELRTFHIKTNDNLIPYIQNACMKKNYGEVLEALNTLQAISRNTLSLSGSLAYGAYIAQVPKVQRVAYFNFLNNLLAATPSGKLSRIEENFPQTQETAISICRMFNAYDYDTSPLRWTERLRNERRAAEEAAANANVNETDRTPKSVSTSDPTIPSPETQKPAN